MFARGMKFEDDGKAHPIRHAELCSPNSYWYSSRTGSVINLIERHTTRSLLQIFRGRAHGRTVVTIWNMLIGSPAPPPETAGARSDQVTGPTLFKCEQNRDSSTFRRPLLRAKVSSVSMGTLVVAFQAAAEEVIPRGLIMSGRRNQIERNLGGRE